MSDDSGPLADLPRLAAEERAAVLDLTRRVAHAYERKLGPLTVYALGLSLADADEATRLARIAELAARVEPA